MYITRSHTQSAHLPDPITVDTGCSLRRGLTPHQHSVDWNASTYIPIFQVVCVPFFHIEQRITWARAKRAVEPACRGRAASVV